MTTSISIPEIAVVELLAAVTDTYGTGQAPAGTTFPAGTQGTVVSAFDDIGRYTVEISDDDGTMLALLDCSRDELKVVWAPTITVNGHEMSYRLVHELVKRTLWKQTAGANLDTDEGCEDAATVVSGLLVRLGRDDYLPADQG